MDAENKPFDADETELKVSEIKNGRSVWHRIRDKLLDDYTSRSFMMVALSVGLFLNDSTKFSSTHLTIVIGIFMGAKSLQSMINLSK